MKTTRRKFLAQVGAAVTTAIAVLAAKPALRPLGTVATASTWTQTRNGRLRITVKMYMPPTTPGG